MKVDTFLWENFQETLSCVSFQSAGNNFNSLLANVTKAIG